MLNNAEIPASLSIYPNSNSLQDRQPVHCLINVHACDTASTGSGFIWNVNKKCCFFMARIYFLTMWTMGYHRIKIEHTSCLFWMRRQHSVNLKWWNKLVLTHSFVAFIQIHIVYSGHPDQTGGKFYIHIKGLPNTLRSVIDTLTTEAESRPPHRRSVTTWTRIWWTPKHWFQQTIPL